MLSVGSPYEATVNRLQPDIDSAEVSTKYERLLYWISSVGGGTRESFEHACVALRVVRDNRGARSALRRLRLLGHLECSDDGRKWAVAPAAVVIFPSNSSRGFIAGQRTPSLLNELGTLCKTEQPVLDGPPRIEVSPDIGHSRIALAGRTAALLADLLPDIEGGEELPRTNAQHICIAFAVSHTNMGLELYSVRGREGFL